MKTNNTIFLSSVNHLGLSHFYTHRMTIIFGISGYVTLVTLYCYAIFGGTEGLGKGCMKIMQIFFCLELIWLTCLFLFIIVQNLKVIIQPPLKNGTLFLLRKSFKRVQCSEWVNMFQSHMRFCLTQWSATRFYGRLRVSDSCPLPSEKTAPFFCDNFNN